MRFIGSKKNLLKDIDSFLSKHLDGSEKVFVDLFGGSNSVGEYFSDRYKIISNDIMYFSYVMAKGSLCLNGTPKFNKLSSVGISDPLKYLSMIDLKDYEGDYVTENFSPAGTEKRMYFTIENAKRIDFIREKIEYWKNNNLITEDEYFYLLNCLLQSIPYVSNVTGTYGAYLKKWDKRAFKSIALNEESSLKKHKYINHAYNTNSLQLIENLKGADIVYIDPPYNTRQYPSNYHVLENIARWEKPKLRGITGQFNLDNEKSDFAMKRKAKQAMQTLLGNLKAKHVLLSYSTDGIINVDELIEIVKPFAKNGKVDINKIQYRKYKSKIYNKKEVYEILLYYRPKMIVDDTRSIQLSLFDDKKFTDKKVNTSYDNATKGFIKSPLNYVGGKYKLLPQIFPLFPKKISTFVDIFSGGANVGINTDAKKIWFNDINAKINEIFRYLQSHTFDEVLGMIMMIIEKYNLSKTNEEGFKKLRRAYNKKPDPILLYVLVAYSFNYQFRFNNKMQYNNPFGRNRSHFSERMCNNLKIFMERLHEVDAVFTDEYFTKLDLSTLDRDSFVYADPPYLITTGSYNDGNRGFVNWTLKQEKELYFLLDTMDKQGIKFAMSNVLSHKGKKNIELLKWSKKYNVYHLNYDYSNSSHNTLRKASDEVLITNYLV